LVDAASIESRLERVRILLVELDEIHEGGRGAYDESLRLRLATQRGLQLAIQACIDIGSHLVAELDLPLPADYRGVFTALVAKGLDAELSDRLGSAAGLRNVLVHDYLDIDEDVVWGSLDHLDDLRRFAAFVVERLDTSVPTNKTRGVD
jgi:uncharacterized protein YutE (UPF0331/DUF86 family)